MRSVLAVIVGLVAWIVVTTLGNLALRALVPGYADVEQAMTFTGGMQAARLLVGAAACFAAGSTAAWMARGAGRTVWALTIVLVVLFIPVHYGLWDRFPLWYHLVFFASLVVVTPAGAALVPGARRP